MKKSPGYHLLKGAASIAEGFVSLFGYFPKPPMPRLTNQKIHEQLKRADDDFRAARRADAAALRSDWEKILGPNLDGTVGRRPRPATAKHNNIRS